MKFTEHELATEQALLGQLQELGLTSALELTESGWELKSSDPLEKNVVLDLERDYQQWQKTLISLRSQPLYRALGTRNNQMPKVWDVTCGLAGDSLQLLAFGCEVISWERHPIPALMLLRAYNRWDNQAKARWRIDFQRELPPEEAQVIYFDPMYSEVNKKALPRKEMRIFREVVGQDSDAEAVARELLSYKKRLIIKRPPGANLLLPNPSFQQEGKAVRLDVYLH